MYIGEKKLIGASETETKTYGGQPILEVMYEDGTKEYMSKPMYDSVVSDKPCDATELRTKRIEPVVVAVITLLRDWGMKVGETPYFSALLNQSLNANTDEALKLMWGQFMPKPNDLDNVDLVTIDRVLKELSPKDAPTQ